MNAQTWMTDRDLMPEGSGRIPDGEGPSGHFSAPSQPGERFAALHRHDRAPEAGPVAGRIDVTRGIIDKGLQTCSDSDHNGREWTS